MKLSSGPSLSPAKALRRRSPLAVAAAGGRPPSPSLWDLAQQAVAGEINPQIAGLTSTAQEQAAAAAAAITNAAKSYADYLAGTDYGKPYAEATPQQAAVDEALRGSLTGQGAALSAGLADRLRALRGTSAAAALRQAGDQLAAQGTGSGNAQLAKGSAELGNLIADEAAAREYGAKQPGIARLAGLQGVKETEGKIATGLQSNISDLESKIPGLVNDVFGRLQTAQTDRARLGIEQQNANTSRARARASIAQGNARLGVEQFNANTSRARSRAEIAQGNTRLRIEANRAAQTALNENRNYSLSLSRLGIESKRLQLSALAQQAKLQSGGFTSEELVKLHKDAGQVIVSGRQNGYTRAQVINNLVANGIPLELAAPLLKRFGYAPPGPGMFAGLSKALKQAGGAASRRPFGGAGSAVESAAAQTIVGMARDYLGTPYVWGGESPKGFDCSGFAQYLYGHAGISIPRTTYTQWTARNGHSVAKNELLPGDLVFFKGSDSRGGLPGHVGVYIGNGKMIDAPHTGADVRVENVDSFGGYMGARRYQKAAR